MSHDRARALGSSDRPSLLPTLLLEQQQPSLNTPTSSSSSLINQNLSPSRIKVSGSSDRPHINLLNDNNSDNVICKRHSIPLSLAKIISDSVYVDDPWHNESQLIKPDDEDYETQAATWRLKERMKTAGVALVVCLNIGTDPPDVIKPLPCARKECWMDPSGQPKQKALEAIGNLLQQQYEKWQSKAKYKQCLDPTSEDLRRVCINLRKAARNDRLLLHYNGHGVPRPTKNGELWVFGKHYTHYMPVAICELRAWLGEPAVYVLDCSGAGELIPHFIDSNVHAAFEDLKGKTEKKSKRDRSNSISLRSVPPSELIQASVDGQTIVLAACQANENLSFNPQYPADIFTACLSTPIPIALRWFILQNPFSLQDVSPELAENIPGKDNDRKTPRGELNWIFTAITDTIAWNTLPSNVFQKMFRQDLLVASLFRNFLLAKRIMKSLNCTPQSWPPLPDSTTHSLWQAWDLALESCLSHIVALQKGSIMVDPKNNLSVTNSTFFSDHLTAFEVWLDFGGNNSEQSTFLPMLLQVLLSQTHRLRALLLLRRYLALGSQAVNLALLVGIFPYILKLLLSPAPEIRQVLVCIWASILGFDPSCRVELVRDKSQGYFIQYLTSKDQPEAQRCMAAFILAEICNGYRDGQQTCLQQGLHRLCTSILSSPEVLASSGLKKWISLCIVKLCEDFLWAKYLCLSEASHTQFYPLLLDPDATVRACALLALGEMFGASVLTGNMVNSDEQKGVDSLNAQAKKSGGFGTTGSPMDANKNFTVEQRELMESELQLALQILINCTDASVLVRREAMIALSKFIVLPTHIGCITLIANSLTKRMNLKSNLSHTKNDTDFDKSRNDSQVQSKHDDDKSENKLKNDKTNIVSSSPWILSAAQSDLIIDGVQQYLHQFLEGGRVNKVNLSTQSMSSSLINDDGTNVPNDSPPPIFSEKIDDKSMAAGYVRLWLAIKEVQCKDPHPLVVMVADAINIRINDQIAYNDKKNNVTKQEIDSTFKCKVETRNLSDDKLFDLGVAPPLSPLGVVITDSINRVHSLKRGSSPGTVKSFNQRKVRNLPRSSPFASNTPSFDDFGGNRTDSIDENEEDDINMDHNDCNVPSVLYDWIKKLFLKPDPGYDSYEDQLSDEGINKTIRENRVKEIINYDIRLKEIFKDVDDKNDHGLDIKAKEEMQMIKANIAASLPSSVTKFEQKAILNIENAEMTSIVMFHAFENILAVSDSRKIGIWSLNNGSCILELNNNPVSDRSYTSNISNNARITSMSWINESYDSLLMVGSDDGTIKIWKDTADPEYIMESNSNSISSNKITPTLASAFMALPDVADTSVGSGMVFSWLQHTGNLVVGGNSNSIRVWDMEREQCVRAFSTGLDTCTTALASHSVNNIDFNNSSPVGGISSNTVSPGGSCRQPGASTPLTWSFAGFADGSIGIFDERVNTLGGRVHLTRDHSAWIVSAHLRPDIPEVITASVRGSVKFWDLRSMRTFKTFEVFKSPLTALSVHNSAPIMATGSHAQFIKILTLNGDQLGNIIKYHDGFLGQRIGPVSCLAFHPTQLLLAAGATDSIVSVYSTVV